MDGIAVGVLVATVVVSVVLQSVLKRKRDGEFPKGPPGWPIVGHLPLLKQVSHKVFAELSRKQDHGILGLHLGSQPTIIVSSAAMAKELLLINDKVFANRPPYEFTQSLFYGYDIGVTFSSYNPHWTRFRKICTLELFHAKRLQHLQHVRLEEVRNLLRTLNALSSNGTRAVALGKHLADMTSNTSSRLLQSKTLGNVAPELPQLIRRLEHHTFPTVGDLIPWLKVVADVVPRRHMKALHNRIDKILDFIVEERRQLMAEVPSNVLPQDFLQVILSKEISVDEEPITTQEIKGILLDILAAGIHTTSVTLEWIVAELVKNPNCLKKLQDEIDAKVAKEKELVTDEDILNLPYLENVVKEVFRLHPVVPLLLPHFSSEACQVGRFFIPKNTLTFVNVWAIGRDPDAWERPDAFCPERFDNLEVDLKGQHYELLPFGSGRRICPGMRLGLSVVHVTLANLVRAFDWHLPPGQTPSSIDMNEMGGFGNIKAIPLQVIPKARWSIP